MSAAVTQGRALAIMGPTAIGKTALAMALADQVPCRLISVDSAMVFKHMNIGTAKPSAEELAAYPHALVDVIEPTDNYSAADFLRDARSEVLRAWNDQTLPVFVGGTMLYYRALRDGLAHMPERDEAVRAQLEDEIRSRGLPAMHLELQKVDPVAAAGMEPQNHQRLIRALEVWRVSGEPISSFWARDQVGLLETLGGRLEEHALMPVDRSVLHERINRRFVQMLEEGFLEEVTELRARGDLSAEMTSMRCVGYRQLWAHLAGETTLSEATRQGQAATRQLAKRQLTWLRGWLKTASVRDWPTAGDPRDHLPALLATLGSS